MKKQIPSSKRRQFFKQAAVLTTGLVAAPLFSHAAQNRKVSTDNLYLLGPMEGYSPHVGALLSSMNMMRTWVVYQVKDLTVDQLDFQIDEQSNSIGAMLWHLAATEKYYQLNTFDQMAWGQWSDEIKQEWDLPMGLGGKARDEIKGHPIDFYLEKLEAVRSVTKTEFAKRDDDWLFESEPFFEEQPTNNYAKWFHVCEHESNHNGQIKFIKKRFPS
ncbi:MAG: DinB family protein [Flavobacteriaceae bacterium]